jgi:hypothetical protein
MLYTWQHAHVCEGDENFNCLFTIYFFWGGSLTMSSAKAARPVQSVPDEIVRLNHHGVC